MMPLAQPEGVDPAHQIGARREHARDLDADRIDIFLGHRRQCGASALAGSFVAEFQMVKYAAVLGIKES